MLQSRKVVYVDMDGTFIPGTEIRNRHALQSIVNEFTNKVDRPQVLIPWNSCNGQDEQRIQATLTEQEGLEGFNDYISAKDFQILAKERYTDTPVDYNPREHMIDDLLYLKEYGITAVLVTNSPREAAASALTNAFALHAKGTGSVVQIKDVFSFVVTKSDVLEAGMNPKPSPDPFILTQKILNNNKPRGLFSSVFSVNPSDVMILEDSGTGTVAGFSYTGNANQVVQFIGDKDRANQLMSHNSERAQEFIDMATPCEKAGHHVQDMAGCMVAICNYYGIAEPYKTTPAQDAAYQAALRG